MYISNDNSRRNTRQGKEIRNLIYAEFLNIPEQICAYCMHVGQLGSTSDWHRAITAYSYIYIYIFIFIYTVELSFSTHLK